MRIARVVMPLSLALVAMPASHAHAQTLTLAAFAGASVHPLTPDSCYRIVVTRARGALSSGRWAQAADLWESALMANEQVPEHWYSYGRALYHAARYRQSVAAFERAMQLGGAPDAPWDIARAYASLGRRKQALRWLGTSLASGERSRQMALEEPAFRGLRDDPGFRELIDGRQASSRRHSGDRREGAPPRRAAVSADAGE